MSLQSQFIGTAKKLKKKVKGLLEASNPPVVFPVRRINGVKLNKRICAMTFDDGPYNMKPSPSNYDGPMTVLLLETLERHGGRGTFDCIGDTSENYPDVCGEEGTAMWGGKAYDHYPDYKKDELAGIKNCPELVDRILLSAHEISCHSYVHRIWGKKPFVYGNREYMGNIQDVLDDLKRFDSLMISNHGYRTRLGRPPHYVDRIDSKFTSYDAYAVMGYQYLGAGPDGGGWLPGKNYEEEIEAMERAVAEPLSNDPDAFCGSIIFQKDGCNMMRRTPVADALELQLRLLDKYGYKVVTVSSLMKMSPFSDLSENDEGFDICAELLSKNMCPAFTDNCIHPEKMPSASELAMVLFGWEAARIRVADDASYGDAYKYALRIASEKGVDVDNIAKSCSSRLDAYKTLLRL